MSNQPAKTNEKPSLDGLGPNSEETTNACAEVKLRPATAVKHPPGVDDVSSHTFHRIHFRHPGYKDQENILITLDAHDSSDGGIHCGTALTICGILANNRWDGYFTATRTGLPLQIYGDDLLEDGEYYFWIPLQDGEDPRYPIVPSFADWSFPHSGLPPMWERLPETDASMGPEPSIIRALDRSCRVTGYSLGTKVAHLCPPGETEWFRRNAMDKYSPGPFSGSMIDSPSNEILLRADIQSIFDQNYFVFTPKLSKLVIHVLSSHPEALESYHNTQARKMRPSVYPFLFARLALAIFPRISGFLSQDVRRRLCIIEGGSLTIDTFSAEICERLAKESRGLAPSRD